MTDNFIPTVTISLQRFDELTYEIDTLRKDREEFVKSITEYVKWVDELKLEINELNMKNNKLEDELKWSIERYRVMKDYKDELEIEKLKGENK